MACRINLLSQMEQEERAFGQQDLFVPWHVSPGVDASESPSLHAIDGITKSNIEHQAVTSGDEAIAMKRFYHVFRVRFLGVFFFCSHPSLIVSH
jgi:hypothetical protein